MDGDASARNGPSDVVSDRDTRRVRDAGGLVPDAGGSAPAAIGVRFAAPSQKLPSDAVVDVDCLLDVIRLRLKVAPVHRPKRTRRPGVAIALRETGCRGYAGTDSRPAGKPGQPLGYRKHRIRRNCSVSRAETVMFRCRSRRGIIVERIAREPAGRTARRPMAVLSRSPAVPSAAEILAGALRDHAARWCWSESCVASARVRYGLYSVFATATAKLRAVPASSPPAGRGDLIG